jgi:hypothetical protein
LNANNPPSDYAIYDLIKGRPGGLPRTVALTAGRAVVILPGLWAAGVRRDMIKTSLLVSLSITLGMMAVKSINDGDE